MNASRIDSLAADYADENGFVSADKVFQIFSECIEEDPATAHELAYGWTNKEDLWDRIGIAQSSQIPSDTDEIG